MRILVAGVGNILLHDDGFGSAVVQLLRRRQLPMRTTVIDFGIRSIHLAFELMNGYDAILLVDTVVRGGVPGTLYVIEPNLDEETGWWIPDPHTARPDWALQTVLTAPVRPKCVRIVGCEPASLEEGIGLTPPVAAVVPRAVDLVVELIAEWSREAIRQGGIS